nr:hypothetical protein [Candidatus Sigynarchaeota archaeon]
MVENIKKLIKLILDRHEEIPRRFWREVLWLNPGRVGITRNGRFTWIDKGGVAKESNWKKFFKHHEDLLDEQEAQRQIRDYLLILKGHELEANEVIHCRNVEIRHFLMGQFPYEKLLKDYSTKIIHQDPTTGAELVRIRMGKGMEELYFVRVIDNTSKKPYLLRVPPVMQSCRQAIAWTFGLSESEYKPLVEK